MAGERVALIDGTSLVYRAYHAIPGNLKTTKGLHTNAIYGFAQMFRKVLAGRTPKFGAVVFDTPGPTRRSTAYPAYKAHRPYMPNQLRDQLPWIDKLVAAHNYPILRIPGVEADDVIGTLTQRALAAGHEVWIVSGDKDFAQLVGERVRMFDSTKEVVYNPELVFKRWAVRPDQFIDYLAMVGDKSDNIPGLPGIGKKRATELLAEHGSLDAMLGRIDQLDAKLARTLRSNQEQLILSRQLATIDLDVAVDCTWEDLQVPYPLPEQLNAVYRELEFYSLLSAEELAKVGTDQRDFEYYVCDTPEMATAALDAECYGDDPVAVQVLYELPSHLKGALVGVALAPRPRFALYFPFAGPGANLGADGLELLRGWLEDPARPKVAHEVKTAWVALKRHGVDMQGVVGDTALASYLVDPTKHIPHRLEQVSREYLQRGLQPLRGLVGGGRDLKRFAELKIDRAGAYACHLADAIAGLWPVLVPKVRSEGQWQTLHELDVPLSFVIGQMELDGVRVDPDNLRRMSDDFNALKEAEETEIFALAGRSFNVGSLKQLSTVLFEEMGLPILKRTKTGYSTSIDVMNKLAPSHPIIDHVLRWRTLAKLINTYTDVLQAAVNPTDGRIHGILMQTVGVSGRLISTEPDLQRTPVRTPEFRRVRQAFVPDPGNQIVSADWSQIELRILAHYSDDPKLVHAYTHDIDVHAQTAAELFGCTPEQIDGAQRDVGKTVNFATIYGQGATALAEQLRIPRRKAKQYIDTFFESYAGVRAWREQIITDAYVNGYVTTLLGRRRYINELSSNNYTDRAYGERICTNTPIQGTGADICKLAMLRIARALRERGLETRMVLQIHDEIVFDAPAREVEAVTSLVREIMESVVALRVPLVVDIGVGDTWDAAH